MEAVAKGVWKVGLEQQPRGIDQAAFIAANATLIGDVQLAEAVSIWYGAISRPL